VPPRETEGPERSSRFIKVSFSPSYFLCRLSSFGVCGYRCFFFLCSFFFFFFFFFFFLLFFFSSFYFYFPRVDRGVSKFRIEYQCIACFSDLAWL
jgi:hypothetical protein